MGKSERFHNKYTVEYDKLTSRKVTCLTGPDIGGHVNHHPYFYNKIFTNDDKNIIYISDQDGNRNIYLLNIDSGNTLQLTDKPGIEDFSPCLYSDDSAIVYATQKGIVKLNIGDLSEETLYTSDEAWQFGSFGISADDKYILLDEMWKADVVHGSGDWSTFEPQWESKPRCRLVLLNTADKSFHTVLEEPHCWLGHPQIRPFHNDQLMFCHEGPGHLIDARIWLINSDGSGMRRATPRKPEERVTTHEFWLWDGSRIAFMYNQRDGRSFVKYLDPASLEQEELMECSHYCHFISNSDNSIIVGDGQPPHEPYLFMIDVKNRSETRLCLHDSSFNSYGTNQDSHPHPAISHNGKYVLFTSDKAGSPNVYLCEI